MKHLCRVLTIAAIVLTAFPCISFGQNTMDCHVLGCTYEEAIDQITLRIKQKNSGNETTNGITVSNIKVVGVGHSPHRELQDCYDSVFVIFRHVNDVITNVKESSCLEEAISTLKNLREETDSSITRIDSVIRRLNRVVKNPFDAEEKDWHGLPECQAVEADIEFDIEGEEAPLHSHPVYYFQDGKIVCSWWDLKKMVNTKLWPLTYGRRNDVLQIIDIVLSSYEWVYNGGNDGMAFYYENFDFSGTDPYDYYMGDRVDIIAVPRSGQGGRDFRFEM